MSDEPVRISGAPENPISAVQDREKQAVRAWGCDLAQFRHLNRRRDDRADHVIAEDGRIEEDVLAFPSGPQRRFNRRSTRLPHLVQDVALAVRAPCASRDDPLPALGIDECDGRPGRHDRHHPVDVLREILDLGRIGTRQGRQRGEGAQLLMDFAIDPVGQGTRLRR